MGWGEVGGCIHHSWCRGPARWTETSCNWERIFGVYLLQLVYLLQSWLVLCGRLLGWLLLGRLSALTSLLPAQVLAVVAPEPSA